MNIKELFNKDEKITIESYLDKCGVDNVEEYFKGNTLEPTTNYDNIDEWCEVLHNSIDKTIYLLVDCDCDGYLSSSMFYTYVKTISEDINIIPIFHHKNPKAHGLGDKDVYSQIKKEQPSLLVILDAGSNDSKECGKLKKLGWNIISSDHHFSNEWNNECVLVNNHMSKSVINKGLCGTGVTWKCLKRYDELYVYNIAKELISYVAFANVSDSMNLSYQENRTFAKWGLQKIHKNIQPFFDEFIKDEITNDSVVWNVTPKLNALIRLGELQDKVDLFYALCGEGNTTDLIERMKKYHSKQGTEKKRLYEKVDMIYNGTCMIAKINEKTPLTGLVANMLSSEYLKPILLLHDNDENTLCSGSVRSVVPIKQQLIDSGLFEYNEGHEDFAFGTAYKKDKESDVINYLDTIVSVCEPCERVLKSYVSNSIPNKLFGLNKAYTSLWSKGVDKPRFHIHSIYINSADIKVLGKGGNIKFNHKGIDYIHFFTSNKLKEYLHMNESVDLEIELIGVLDNNVWNGKISPQVLIENGKIECKVAEEKELSIDDIF